MTCSTAIISRLLPTLFSATCPNKCSGHGICRTVSEIAGGALNRRKTASIQGYDYYTGVQNVFDYHLWDQDKNQACVCDPGYTGHDCSLRECPRGDDPLTHDKKSCGGSTCVDEVQKIVATHTAANGEGKFYLSFVDWTNQTWWTDLITIPQWESPATAFGTADAIKAGLAINQALLDIPNGVFEHLKVTATYDSTNKDMVFTITFTENPGNLEQLSLHEAPGDLNFDYTVSTVTDGNKEEVVCSNRGLCDHNTGLCKCFKGYFYDDCSVQSALAT